MIVTADLDGDRETVAAHPTSEGPIRATPVARKMAQEAGLQLEQVSGSGPSGQITRHDVEKALTAARAARERPLHEPPPEQSVRQLTGLRAAIARRLSAAWRDRPQVTLTTQAEATNLVSARQQVIAETGERVAYDAFLVMLAARALGEQPNVNVRLTEAGVEMPAQFNIGVAVDTERGLLVPVVHDAANRGLLEIHRTLLDLAERAKAGTLLPDDLTGGTFTITNLGMFEIDAFTPIVNPPECAILGVGRIHPQPVAINEQVVVRPMVTLSLSFDHRLIDGGPAARFLQRVKQLVERPFALTVLH
jgi:pyruvate dehydrogenase E2 component (dihydrolipoamide acetyltransferase)